jgi:septal ring factor EnvC (AmiA/AmiB activator)
MLTYLDFYHSEYSKRPYSAAAKRQADHIAILESDNDTLRSELTQAKDEHASLNSQLVTMRSEYAALTERYKKSEATLASATKALSELRREATRRRGLRHKGYSDNLAKFAAGIKLPANYEGRECDSTSI